GLLAGGIAAGAVRRWMPAPPPAPGEITFEYDTPDARIALRRGDEPEREIDIGKEKTLSLAPGDYTLRPVGAAEKQFLLPGQLVVESGAKQTVVVQLVGEAGSHRAHAIRSVGG